MTRSDFHFSGVAVPSGARRQVLLPAGKLPTGTELSLPVNVLHGDKDGPTIWLSGAIHGDEVVGVEIIRQVLERVDETDLSGTIIAAPVVNVFGFNTGSRYLPDRRDLNRCFPGSKRGSLAARLARLFLDQVVTPCAFGLDFHAGSDDRTNLPQIRGDMEDPETRRLALAFGAPLVIHSKPIRGSLRDTTRRRGKRSLLFEGGEPRRFSPRAVEEGVVGTLRVLYALAMTRSDVPPPEPPPRESRSTHWARAPRGGIFRLEAQLGSLVSEGQRIGVIGSPSDRDVTEVVASASGVVMGHAVNPLVHRGEGLVHIAASFDEDGSPHV